ncbi:MULTISPECIES: DUF6118 family protein [Sphingobium]|jgi:hypothetical protein|uniref:Uncharacterized protein n=1 Tax=Sphingobium yanoikuyae TaxID=13690 RepID=A0A0J9CTS1_SPHYA|nr:MULTISPECIES: DUF6118 family protein [Sphingobium]ATP20251.1 hypothetical protein BV87_18885 [Sphingobium yanoikuyae]KMW28174.1 hypothetical protein BV87_25060 [Sphingobium yanoikuyae]TKV40707.1 hypothetical protein A0U87_05535 [Sphingobium sp. MP9-4]
MIQQDPQQDDPVEAFDAVRRELSLLRHALEGLTAAREKIPDYSATLAQINKSLDVHAHKLDMIQSRPAMEMTPEALVERIIASAQIARAEDRTMLHEAQDGFSRKASQIDRMIARGRGAAEQEIQVILFCLGGFLSGILLWTTLPGAVARSLPESWHVPERMAARMMGMKQIDAGRRMIVTAPERIDENVVNAIGDNASGIAHPATD